MKVHLVGGFLGSGKTTAIAAAVRLQMARGLRAAAITNDQGNELVDAGYLEALGIPTGQVAGGCFCCAYADLASEIERIRREVRPDLIFAEAVGSCTDLVATVARPLQRGYLASVDVTSYSVFVDVRLMGMWLSGIGLPFSEDVSYIFERQLAEAGILVLNKADVVSPPSGKRILRRARATFPNVAVILQSSLDAGQVAEWLELVERARSDSLPSVSVDYERYGAGEARLAWYDATIDITGARPSLGCAASALLDFIRESVKKEGIVVGHLKILVKGKTESRKVSLTLDAPGEGASLRAITDADGTLLLNFRAEASADQLEELVRACTRRLADTGSAAAATARGERAFHPGFPTPTWRLA